METIRELWEKYNEYANKLTVMLKTSNIVGEYAEHLATKYYQGEHLGASHPSADIKGKDGKLIQVKSRKHKTGNCTQLGVIRSWDFHLLVVIMFDLNGKIIKALEVPVDVAKESKYAVWNKHQHGWVITTTNEFLNDPRSRPITEELKNIE